MYARTDEEAAYEARIEAQNEVRREAVEVFRRAANQINELYRSIAPQSIGADCISGFSRQDPVWIELQAMIGEWC